MKRKTALVIVLAIVFSIAVSYPLWSPYLHRDTRPKYEKTIARNTDTLEEANALTVAENSDYPRIFNLQRYATGDHYQPWPYTWANFIDTQVIQYYDNRFENLEGETEANRPKAIEFHYEADVFAWNQIRIVYVPAPEGGNIDDDSIQVLSQNGSVLLENAQYTGPRWGMKFAYWNGSEYLGMAPEELDFSLAESYVIEMTLRYEEIWGPVAGFTVDAYQIIVVNQSFTSLLFCIQSGQGIA